MNDKALMEDLLQLAKGTVDLYSNATVESSSNDVHCAFQDALNTTLTLQNDVYKTMEAAGWYQMCPVEQQKIAKVEQKFNQATL